MRQRLRGDDGGFSVVEMLASLAVVMVMGTAVAGGLTTAMKASKGSRERVIATSLATQALEQARSMPATSLVAPSTTTWTSPQPGGPTFTITRAVAWRNSPGITTTSCSGAGMFKHVALTVTWPGGAAAVKSDTLIAPPETGSQRVRVLDRNRSARSGVPVTIAGGPTAVAPQTTDAKGCVLFPGLTPGTYTISVTQSGGTYPYVDPQGLTVTGRTVTISNAEPPPLVELQYDRSGAIAGTPVATAGYPLASPLGATVFHPDLLPSGTRKVLSAAPTTVGSLFPFRTGQYKMWAGTCSDADPAFHGFGRPASITVTPGAVTNRTLPTKPVYIRVRGGGNGSNAWESNAVMVAVHAATDGCGPVANTGAAGGQVGMVVQFPLVTDSSGYARVSLPYGTWRFEPRAGQGFSYYATASNGQPNSVRLTPASSTTPALLQVNVGW